MMGIGLFYKGLGMKNLLDNEDTHLEYQRMLPFFKRIYDSFLKLFPGFSTQSPQSMIELYLLVSVVKPKTIFELGTGYRASTLAMSLSANKLQSTPKMVSFDLKPRNFMEIVGSLSEIMGEELNCAAVEDIQGNALEYNIPEEWEKPIFVFYDAHDTPKCELFKYAIDLWFPKLKGQTVAVHDCSVTAKEFPITLSDHRLVRHFSGRYISGFYEVIPMTNWMNENRVDFSRPIDEIGGEKSSIIYFEIPICGSENDR